MGGEWRKVQLQDIVTILGDGLHGTPKYDEDGEYYFINGNNLENGRIVFRDATKRVAHDQFLKHKKNLNDRTILVSINGTIGNVAYYNGEKVILGKSACYFNLIGEVEKGFVRYVLSGAIFQNYLNQYATGTTIKNVSLKDMREFSFRLPPTNEQKSIAHILGTLDDKIELNRQMNATLEAMAQALFKSWFVDFDPVIDNALAAGNPIPDELQARAEVRAALGDKRKPLPEAIQKQFPSSFVFSEEMGWIPEGWEVQPIEKVVGQRNERIEPSEVTRSMSYVPIDCISSKSLFLSESKDGEEAQSSLIRFYEGDILFGAMRPYFHKVCIAPFDGTTRTTAFVLRPQRQEDFSFAVLQLHQERTIEYATAHSTGTTIPYAKWKNSLSRMPIICPPELVRDAFSEMVTAILQKIPTKYSEVQTLAELRDALLPQLLSGQLRIPDAEKLVAEAEK